MRIEARKREHLVPYLSPDCIHPSASDTRRADKTGLIAWKANKYSVPMDWQQARGGVLEADGQLHVSDLSSDEVIASHLLSPDKGRIIKNTHHYRDHAQRLATLEAEIAQQTGEDTGHTLCQQLKQSEPKIYKDQLVAVRNLLRNRAPIDPAQIDQLARRPGMTARRLREYLEASQTAIERERTPEPLPTTSDPLNLSAYAQVGHSSGQGVTQGSA